MSFWESLLGRPKGPLARQAEQAAPRRGATDELFDDEFLKRLESLSIVSRKVAQGRQRAERRSKKRGSGVEFADHRNYVVGDDIRFLDFGVYQRLGKLLIRLYEEEEDLSVYFLVDCSASMGFGEGKKFDQARRLAAALAYVALSSLDRVTIVAARDEVVARMPTTRGKARIFRVFRFLSGLDTGGHTDLREAMKAFVAQHKRRGVAVLLSDLYDPAGFEGGIDMLRFNKFEPYVVHLVDPSDAKPRLRGDVRVVDVESGEDRDVTVTQGVLGELERSYEAYRKSIERYCASRQVPYFAASVEEPFDELVLRVFRRGGFVG